MAIKSEILNRLRNTTEYISGQALCEEFQVSRTAVWKAIKQLKEEGYEIDSVSNRGYRLVEVPETLSKEEIESQLETKWLGRPLCFKETIDSTNELAKKLAIDGATHGTVVLGDQQLNGKGRRGRTWESPLGSSIYISYLLRPEMDPMNASMLTIVAALATAKAIEETQNIQTQIKWPNDILVDKRKVCGILTEMSADMDGIDYVVVGIGVNVNVDFTDAKLFSKDVRDVGISLKEKTGQNVNRSSIITKMMSWFEFYYDVFMETQDLSNLMEEYNSHLVNRNQQVRIIERGGEWEGTAKSMNSKGELLVINQEQKEVAIMSGEVSVRGIYGYA